MEGDHLLIEIQLRAAIARRVELHLDASLRSQITRGRFEVALLTSRQVKLWVAIPQLRRRELFVLDVIEACCRNGSGEKIPNIVLTLALVGTQHQAATLGEQFGTGSQLQLPPDLVRAPDQRYVFGSFSDGKPGDPGVAVRRAPDVGRGVPVEPENPGAGLRQLVYGCASHRPEPNHDDVVVGRIGRCGRALGTHAGDANRNSRIG